MLVGIKVFVRCSIGAMSALLLSPAGAWAQSGECACLVSADAVGVVQNVQGAVFISQSGGSVPLKKAARVPVSSSIISGPKSASTIAFGSGCTLRMADNSALQSQLQNGKQCLNVSAQNAGAGSAAGTTVATTSSLVTPATIAAAIGGGALVVGVANRDRSVSR